jgi:hypothetical protein
MELLSTITQELLQIDEGMLSVAFVNFNGQTLASKSKYCIKIGLDPDNMTGLWMRAAIAMVEQCSKTFGKVSTFVTSYEKVKLAVWPQNGIRMLILLVLLPSTSIEYVINKVSSFLTSHKELFGCRNIEYKWTPNGTG